MSASLFGVCLAIFAAVWLGLAARGMARVFKTGGSLKWIIALMGLLVIVGGAGFFASGLSAVGFIKFPRSFQWPAGYVIGVVRAPDGKYIVPLVPSGRVQIYDSQWHFLRGWHVDAFGGDFGVASTGKGIIDVITARQQRHYTFTEDGDLISDRPASELDADRHSLQAEGSGFVVPTSPLLWIFSSPFICWGAVVVGGVGIYITRKLLLSRR